MMQCAVAVQSVRIVLVDDHRTVLWGLEKLIQSVTPRMRVVAAATCQAEALTAIENHKPDVVLLDLDLGQENGLRLIPHAREHKAKVVILTGIKDADLERRAIMAGASGLVHKSEPASVILQAIERVQQGEIWLDRGTTAKIFASLSNTSERHAEHIVSGETALTATERKVIAAVMAYKAAPNKVIADALHISSHTLRNHLASIYSKLGMHRRIDLVFYAMERIG